MLLNDKSTLYHGTASAHDTIDLSLCSRYKDFGRGYYLTSYPAQAISWAQRRGKESGVCWIYEYHISPSKLILLNELPLVDYDPRWLTIISHYRTKGYIPEDVINQLGIRTPETYDVIYDRMADNMGNQLSHLIDRFLSGSLSTAYVLNKIRFRQLHKDQYCFKTNAAIGFLNRTKTVKYVLSSSGTWKILKEE